jgi:hypothetical protein
LIVGDISRKKKKMKKKKKNDGKGLEVIAAFAVGAGERHAEVS